MNEFRAFVLDSDNGQVKMEIKQLSPNELPEGEVTVRVAYSSVNFKDGMVSTGDNRFIKSYPLIPGIDLSGTVVESRDERFRTGDPVIVTSYELGVTHHGGYSEIARVPAKWVVPLPSGLSLREAMILGTAGFTSALSVQRLEESGLKPEQGPVLVAGATGGVGSIAVNILSKRGYEVVASTGKNSEHEYLRQLGATHIIHRDEIVESEPRALRERRWAGAVDPVGGKTLQYILSTLKYGGSVATSGLTGGSDVATTVFPFISRSVSWLGADSVNCPMEIREKIWSRLGNEYKPEKLEYIANEISLEELSGALGKILQGKMRGRTIVKL